MSLKKRIERIESRVPMKSEPLFYCWLGQEWTEEEKAEAIRKNPGQAIFMKRLSDTIPIEDRLEGIGREEERPGADS